MEKTEMVQPDDTVPTVGAAVLVLYKQLPQNVIPQSVRVVVTTRIGLEHARGTTLPVAVATIGANADPRPIQLPVDFIWAKFCEEGLVYLTYSVKADKS